MAKLVYGFGCSHGPLLSTPPERWDLRAADDRKNPEHPFRGKVYTFPELVEARRGEKDSRRRCRSRCGSSATSAISARWTGSARSSPR